MDFKNSKKMLIAPKMATKIKRLNSEVTNAMSKKNMASAPNIHPITFDTDSFHGL